MNILHKIVCSLFGHRSSEVIECVENELVKVSYCARCCEELHAEHIDS